MNLTDKQLKKFNNREYRALTMSASDNDSDALIVTGYATTFNQPYELYRDKDFIVYEVVDSRAFDNTDMSDVIMQYDHEGRVFARIRNNTLNLDIDDFGLRITADLGGTDIGKQLYQEIKGGYTDKMSYAYVVGREERNETIDPESGKTIVTRRILEIKKVYDVSAVSIPANDYTSISARNYADGVISIITAERLAAERKKLKIKLLMEV